MGELSIRNLIDRVERGEIRIPAFQRGFVWDAERISFLMDSIHKGYPFGSVILWQTRERLKTERQLGPFQLPDPEDNFPINYVLDGQQRLTSIFGTFQTDLTPEGSEGWPTVYFDFAADVDLQESQFIILEDGLAANPKRHFPINTFFNTTEYRKATRDLSDAEVEIIDKVQSNFKEAKIPTQDIVTDNRGKVAIVFERVNRLGVELDVLQLLSAWTWSEDFDLQKKFEELAEVLAPFGFGEVGADSNLLLRCCSAIIAGDAAPSTLMNMNGAEVRERFDEISNGIQGAIDFVKQTLQVAKLGNLPYTAVLVPLSVFFAHKDGGSIKVTDPQRSALKRWLWRSFFSKRYSAGVLRNLKRDIDEILKLKDGKPSALGDISVNLDEDFFKERKFQVTAVDSKTFVLVLVQASPLSFVSASPVDLSSVLKAYNRSEFHHIYPQAYLKKSYQGELPVGALANFAMISAADNKTLGGKAPSSYKGSMATNSLDQVLASALVGDVVFGDDYEKFIDDRACRLLDFSNRLMA